MIIRMIQAILSYQFVLEPGESGILEPDFRPIMLNFNSKDFSKANYDGLVVRTDIFAIFYQHTTGISSDVGAFSNFNELLFNFGKISLRLYSN